MGMWMDLTLRPSGEAEISVEPDGTVELSWREPCAESTSAVTLLLTPDQLRDLVDDAHGMILLGKIRRNAA